MISLGSQSQLGIGIAIELQDRFSGTADKVAARIKGLKNAANDAVMSQMRNYRNNSLAVAAAAGAITYGIGGMTDEAAEFQHAINKIAVIGGASLGRSREQLMQFANSMAKQYTQTPLEVANAMYENAKAGITTGLENITKYQIATATAVGEQLDGPNGVAEKLLGIMNAMDIAPSKFGNIANAITATANATISNVSDIGEAMQYAAFSAKRFNIPMEMTLALIGKLSQAKITGSSAGTGISNMLLQLAKSLGPLASKKQHKIWAMLGLDEGQMANLANNGDINGVVLALSKATQRMSPVVRNSLLSDLFNRRGDRAIEGMFDSKNGNVSAQSLYKANLVAMRNNTVISQSAAMMDDLKGDLAHFTNAMITFKNNLIISIGPMLRFLIQFGQKVITVLGAIAKTPIGKIFLGIGVVVVPLIGILFTFRAALLTAAIALNGFSQTAAAGGFRSLFGGGMDMFSKNKLAASGIAINRSGRAYVAAGESVNIAGKIYKGGQLLPGAFQAGGMGSKVGNFIGMGAMAEGIGGWGAKLGGFAGKALPWIGRLVGFGLKWLPVIGMIWTAVDLLSDIFGFFKHKESSTEVKFQRGTTKYTVDKYLSGSYNPAITQFQDDPKLKPKDRVLQTINVHVDGKKAMSQQIQSKDEDDAAGQLNINTIH